jgi:hypothetical protein
VVFRAPGGMAGVEPTFGFFLLFPPPAPGPLRLARRYRAGARGAADREKPAIVQWVVGYTVIADEGDDAIPRPVEQWVHFEHLMFGVKAGVGRQRALGGLVGAQSRDPTRSTGKGAAERLYLA